MGCGLKWENNLLYKVADTKLGTLSAELIRDFMEFLRMDYSLSVFIPECSISPERLKKEEILAKLGLKNAEGFQDLPILYYIVYHFMYSLMNPEADKFFNDFETKDIEKNSDQIIENNLRNFVNQNAENGENNMQNAQVQQEPEDPENGQVDEVNHDQDVRRNNSNQNQTIQRNSNQQANQRISNAGVNGEMRQDTRNISNNIQHDDHNNSDLQENYNIRIPNSNTSPDRPQHKHYNPNLSPEHNSEIGEEIVDYEESYDRESDKKLLNSGGNFTISQSGQSGVDGTVDSNTLEKYNYIENIDKHN